jgi:2-keto-4-pentenoate hydratase/2-oxohepta-3-ene-1,7-dioic acid hydratase in catechol pathway
MRLATYRAQGRRHVIEMISAGLTLMPPDIIATATPAGIGALENPAAALGAAP